MDKLFHKLGDKLDKIVPKVTPSSFAPDDIWASPSISEHDIYRYRKQMGINLGVHIFPILPVQIVKFNLITIIPQVHGSLWKDGSPNLHSAIPNQIVLAIWTLRMLRTPSAF
jgi:hypothetical protein